MKLRGKFYNLKTKGVYTVMSVDFVAKTIIGIASNKTEVARFKDVIWLASTGIKAENDLFIYQDDFVIIVNENDGFIMTGIVKQFSSGQWMIINRKLDKALPLLEIVEKGLKIITKQNYKLYFAKKNKLKLGEK